MLNCIVLSGGKSSRMGVDKAMLPFGESPLLQYIVKKLKSYKEIDQIIIVSNNGTHQIEGALRYNDIFMESGPLGALYTGLFHSNTTNNLILSCDSPFFDDLLLSELINNMKEYDSVVPVFNDKSYFLMGIYSKNTLSVLKNQLLLKRYKVSEMLALINVNYLKLDNKLKDKTFLNLNTDQEYQIALKILENENNN